MMLLFALYDVMYIHIARDIIVAFFDQTARYDVNICKDKTRVDFLAGNIHRASCKVGLSKESEQMRTVSSSTVSSCLSVP